MTVPKSTDLHGVLLGIDKLLADIETESKVFAFSALDEGAPSDLRKAGLEAMADLLETPVDGAVDLTVSDDAMVASVDFFPPFSGGYPISPDRVLELLAKTGVVHGILLPVIRDYTGRTARELKSFENIAVAKGTPPIDFLPPRWEVVPSLLEGQQEVAEGVGFRDFMALSPFRLVRQGDLLACLIPGAAGARGRDVLGRELEFRILEARPLDPGKNVVVTPEGYRAGCDGCFHSEGTKLRVDPILVLESGVGYATGHINFIGDIHITGDVAAGFRIHAEGSIHSTRVIDATEVVSGGDVVTPLGIIGRDGSVVKAEGRVRAKFLENLYVLSRGTLEIQSSVLNCCLNTLDRLVMGPKGLVLGGRIQAQNGVDVYQIGSERGAKAELVCGMDFSVLDKVCWARDQSLSLVKQMRTLAAYRSTHPGKGSKVDDAIEKVREQIRKLSELSRSLAAHMDRNEDAAVTVRGTVYPGTYIEICHVSHVVPKTLSRIKFILDKKKGQIQAVPL